MPRKRRLAKPRRGELSGLEDAELMWGGGPPSVFESPFIKRAAWILNRGDLLEVHPAGWRPAAWWQYEAPEQQREGEGQAEALARMGLLEDWETVEVAAWAQIRAEGEQEERDAEKLPD